MNGAYSFQTSGWWQNIGTFQTRHNFQSICPFGIQIFWNYEICVATYVNIYCGKDRICATEYISPTHRNVRHLAKR